MEDTHVALDRVEGVRGEREMSLYAVYDGHGGIESSILAQKLLHPKIIHLFNKEESDMFDDSLFLRAFKETDEEILVDSRADNDNFTSGTTAVLVLVLDGHVLVANAGDSEAVIGSYCIHSDDDDDDNKDDHHDVLVDSHDDEDDDDEKEDSEEFVDYDLDDEFDVSVEPLVLTHKHKPTNEDEKARIKAAGGHVVFGRVMGSLAVARALGDRDLKVPFNKSEGDFVSSTPFLKRMKIDPRKHRFMIVSCDGLWEKMSYQGAVDFVAKARREGKSPEATVEALVEESISRGSLDNVTAILVYFSPPPKPTTKSKLEKKSKKKKAKDEEGSNTVEEEEETYEEEDEDLMDVWEFLAREWERRKKTSQKSSHGGKSARSDHSTDASPKANRKKKESLLAKILPAFRLPDGEGILADLSFVLEKHAALICTTNYLCFFSKGLFGKKNCVSILISDISDATLVDDSLKIRHKNGRKSSFSLKTKFVEREKAFSQLKKHIDSHNDDNDNENDDQDEGDSNNGEEDPSKDLSWSSF